MCDSEQAECLFQKYFKKPLSIYLVLVSSKKVGDSSFNTLLETMYNNAKYGSKLDNAVNLADEILFAFLANFLFTGAGQIYLKKTKKGVVLILVSLVLFPLSLFLPFLIIFSIVYWIWGLIEAVRDAKSVLKVRSLRENTISLSEFESELAKLHQLLKSNIIGEKEFIDKKLELLSRLENSITSENKNDVLLSLVRLRQQNLLSEIDYQQIRNYSPLT